MVGALWHVCTHATGVPPGSCGARPEPFGMHAECLECTERTGGRGPKTTRYQGGHGRRAASSAGGSMWHTPKGPMDSWSLANNTQHPINSRYGYITTRKI